jgi:hypothetical protein
MFILGPYLFAVIEVAWIFLKHQHEGKLPNYEILLCGMCGIFFPEFWGITREFAMGSHVVFAAMPISGRSCFPRTFFAR